MTDGSGPPPWMRYAEFGPDGSCGRTRVLSLDLGEASPSAGFSAKWPRSATWDRTGVYVLPTSAPVTDGTDCSSSGALLPTPTVGDSKAARNSTATRHVLPPTGIHAGNTLTDAVTLLPTPTANQYECEPEVFLARQERCKETAQNGKGFGLTTAMAVALLLPTPTSRLGDDSGRRADAARYKGPKSMGGRRSNLDDAVEAVRTDAPWIGATTPPPSPGTPPCSDDPPRLPLTTGNA